MVQGGRGTSRKTGRQKTFLDTSRMGCRKTWAKRSSRKDGMEKLETEVARKSKAA